MIFLRLKKGGCRIVIGYECGLSKSRQTREKDSANSCRENASFVPVNLFLV